MLSSLLIMYSYDSIINKNLIFKYILSILLVMIILLLLTQIEYHIYKGNIKMAILLNILKTLALFALTRVRI